MKLTAYLTLLIWAGALVALSYSMLLLSRDARIELGHLIWGETSERTSPTPAVVAEFSKTKEEGLPSADETQLLAGLEALKATLNAYSVRLMTTAQAASTEETH